MHHMMVCMAHRFWSNTIKANLTMSVVLLDWQKMPTAILIQFFTWVLESELLVSVSNRHFQRADSNFFCMFVTVSLLVCICVFLSVSLTLRMLFCVWRQDAPWVRLQKVGACRWQPSTRWQITTQLRQTSPHTNYTKWTEKMQKWC